MGDWFQVIVDQQATEADAPLLAQRVVAWLIAEGIIEDRKTDSILGEDGGYPPGPQYRKALDMDNPAVAQEVEGHDFRRLRTNGLEVVTERMAFMSGQGGVELICAACGERIADDDFDGAWQEAINAFYTGEGSDQLACPRCGATEAVSAWTHDPPWGFGYLGFQFWNWPNFSPAFLAQVSQLLGHPIRFVSGKF